MSEHEKRLETLEEKFSRLREQGIPDKDILREVFEENLNADIDELVRITGLSKLDIGRVKGSVSSSRRRRAKREEVPEAPEPPTPYKTGLDATSILREILKRHPDIPPKVVDEVCSWAEYGPIHPTQLVYLLQSMRGIQSTTANIVAQKYALALQKAQAEGVVQIPPPMYSPQLQQTPSTTPFFTALQPTQPQAFPFQVQPSQPRPPPLLQPSPLLFQRAPQPAQPQPGWAPYIPPTPPTGLYTKEDVDKLRSDWVKEERLKSLEDKLGKLHEEIPKLVKEAVPQQPTPTPTPTQYEEVREFIDKDGNVCPPEKAASIRIKRVPISLETKGLTAEEVRRIIKEEREVVTPDKTKEIVREVIRQEIPKRTEPEVKPITPEDLEKAAATAAKQVMEAHEKEEAAERRHKELLDAIRTSTSEKVVEGYRSDAYRFLGQGMQEMARVIEKKEPVKTIMHGVERVLGATPPPKEVEEGAKEGILSQVRPEWVTPE